MSYSEVFSKHNFRAPRPPRGRGNMFRPNVNRNWVRPPPLLSESLLLPSSHQPPPMFGPRGATIPPSFLGALNISEDWIHGSDESHWCETCDRGFKNFSMLENHKKEHQRCNIDGCQFIAHPKVITKHIQMQHSSGLYNKISKLKDPEEIQKWRDERRKKFPTKSNIEMKKAALKEKIERGEKMGLQKHIQKGNFNDKRNDCFGVRKKGIRKRPKKIEKACPSSQIKHKLPEFTGISQLIVNIDEKIHSDDAHFLIDDEMDDFVQENGKNANEVCGAITQLIADYGSSEEDDSLCKEVSGTNLTKRNITTNTSNYYYMNDVVNGNNGDDSGPEEVKTIRNKEEANPNITATQENIATSINSKSVKPFSKSIPLSGKTPKMYVKKLHSTLLEKLLFKEIRHERNITLQCVRYIIQNNFFKKE